MINRGVCANNVEGVRYVNMADRGVCVKSVEGVRYVNMIK
jgi:hypothetical protein